MARRLISIRPASLFEVETTCDFDKECLNGGYCETEVGLLNDSSHCVCDPAYTGHHCELPIQEVAVATHPPTAVGCGSDEDCQNGGRCYRNNDADDTNAADEWMPSPLGGRCECPATHYGFRCEEKCPCLHGGTCLNSPSTGLYQCQCTDAFYDVLCATRFDGITLPGHNHNNNRTWSIVGFSFGLSFFLVLWIANFPATIRRRRSRGIVGTDKNEDGGEEGDSRMAARGAGNPGVERIPDGGIVYRNGKEESEEEGWPIREDLSVDDTLPTTLSDLELI